MLKTTVTETDGIMPPKVRSVAKPAAKPAAKAVGSFSVKVTTVVADEALNPVMENTVLERLLTMARRYQKSGNVNAAMEMYWELAEDHIDAVEGKAARVALLDLAAKHEREGAVHMARAIYERILVDVEE
jgi:hypothetical protein